MFDKITGITTWQVRTVPTLSLIQRKLLEKWQKASVTFLSLNSHCGSCLVPGNTFLAGEFSLRALKGRLKMLTTFFKGSVWFYYCSKFQIREEITPAGHWFVIITVIFLVTQNDLSILYILFIYIVLHYHSRYCNCCIVCRVDISIYDLPS